LSAHVGFPYIRTGFAPAPGVFFTAERPPDLSSGSADIDIGDTAVAAQMAEECFRFGKDIANC
jgi:hypothetical protein